LVTLFDAGLVDDVREVLGRQPIADTDREERHQLIADSICTTPAARWRRTTSAGSAEVVAVVAVGRSID
jgi:hypothetical protein